jgi:hypothetical protein
MWSGSAFAQHALLLEEVIGASVSSDFSWDYGLLRAQLGKPLGSVAPRDLRQTQEREEGGTDGLAQVFGARRHEGPLGVAC